jgi:hypothetical protein
MAASSPGNVRFAPKADKQQIVSVCPLCANRVLMHCGKKHSRFGHLVSTRQQFIRHSKAERFGGLEVDDKLELDRLLDRKHAAWLPQDAVDIRRRAAQQLGGDQFARHQVPGATQNRNS